MSGDMRELRHLCGHSQPDFGEWVGVAPSMSQKGSLMLRKKMGGNQRSANFPLGWCQVSFGKLRKKATFRGTWWGPFSRTKQSGKLPERRRLQKIGHSQEHRWRNSHSFANIRLGMSHRWRNSSYPPTSINQPNQNMLHRSELSQGRRQNQQERHQSCPKTGGKTTRKDIRVIPRQEAKPPGKTSELSFLGHRWRNCLLSWDNSDRCGIFWLGWLMDVGRYEGVAPSIWAFPAWFWRMSGSCAMSQKGSLMLRKKMGGNQRSANFPLGWCQVSFGKLRKKPLFGGLGGARFPGPSKVANCQSVEDCKK